MAIGSRCMSVQSRRAMTSILYCIVPDQAAQSRQPRFKAASIYHSQQCSGRRCRDGIGGHVVEQTDGCLAITSRSHSHMLACAYPMNALPRIDAVQQQGHCSSGNCVAFFSVPLAGSCTLTGPVHFSPSRSPAHVVAPTLANCDHRCISCKSHLG